MARSIVVVALSVVSSALSGCSGSDGPSTPTAVTAAVSVTLAADVIRVTETTQASATATTTSGPQPVATGWQSDAPAVASVTPSGLVTGVGQGRATIFVMSGGRQGAQVIKVNPDYQGVWQGTYTRRNCVQTGAFVSSNPCGTLSTSLPTQLTMTQSRDSVSGSFFLGSLAFPAFTGPIAGDGSLAFTSTSTGDLPIIATWRVNASPDGRLNGALSQIWRINGAAGELRIDADISSVARVSAAAIRFSSGGLIPRSIREAAQALGTK